jgi:hypothetical protein
MAGASRGSRLFYRQCFVNLIWVQEFFQELKEFPETGSPFSGRLLEGIKPEDTPCE